MAKRKPPTKKPKPLQGIVEPAWMPPPLPPATKEHSTAFAIGLGLTIAGAAILAAGSAILRMEEQR